MPWKQETCIPVGLAGGCPWQVDMLTFWLPPSSRTNIDFKVAAVRGIRRTSKAEAVVAEIDTGNEFHLMESGSSGLPEVVLLNTSQTDISACGVLRTRDFYGEGADVPFAVALSAGERKAVGLPGEFGKGMWRVICDLTADDGSIASSTLRFAVIGGGKPGRVWKGREKFRVGICYHPVYYSEREESMVFSFHVVGRARRFLTGALRIRFLTLTCLAVYRLAPAYICHRNGRANHMRREKRILHFRRRSETV